MRETTSRRLAWSLWAALTALLASELLLLPFHRDAALLFAVAPAFTTIGAFVASRRPANPVGWLLLAFGGAIVVRSFGTQYAYHAFVSDPGSLPAAGWVGSIAIHAWHPSFVLLSFLFLLFPDGRLLSHRWRPLAWLAAGIAVVGLVSGMLEATFLTDAANLPFVDPPVTAADSVAAPVFDGFLAANGAVLLASAAACMLRFRRSQTVERLQLKWLAYAVAVTVLALPVSLLLIGDGRGFAVAATLIPAAAAMAILRYRLYDIDVIVRRSLVYGTLTLFVLLVYGAVVAIAQTLAFALPAAALVAVGLVPVRDAVQRAIGRLLYGERDDPYAALAGLSRRLELVIAPEEVLTVIAETVATSLKLPYVAIELADDRIAATSGEAAEHCLRIPLSYQGAAVGALVLAPRAGETGFARSDRRLLDDLARQTGIAVHAVALTSALQRSRERLVTAREEERRRLRRDLHDGLGPMLAALVLELDVASRSVASDPAAAAAMLSRLREELQQVIVEIRRLVYALRPPALDDLGLLGALREHAQRLDGGTRVSLDLPDSLPPLPAAVEVAAYRIALEALTNVARHAAATTCTLRLSTTGGLELEVCDDGRGLPTLPRAGVGLSSMRERAAEVGGACSIEPAGAHGTRIRASLPLETAP